MIAKKSPLTYVQFYLLSSDYEFVDGEPDKYENIEAELFNQYEIEIDFVNNLKDDNDFNLYTRISVNYGKNKLPGHSLRIEGTGLFELNKENLNPDVISNLSTLSALTMMISSIRGYIMNLTGYSPMGKFVLPSLDINDIIKQKNEKKKRHRKKSPDLNDD